MQNLTKQQGLEALFTDITDFHEKFGLNQPQRNAKLSNEEWKLRHSRLLEEYREFLEAVCQNDYIEMLDAFVDLSYIALGTIYRKGWPLEPTHHSGLTLHETISAYCIAVGTMDQTSPLSTVRSLLVQIVDTCSKVKNFQEAWDRVHAANMAKERGNPKTSKYGSGFDIVKPEGWTAPDLSDLV